MNLNSHIKATAAILALQLFISQVYRISFLLTSKEDINPLLFIQSLWVGFQFDVGVSCIVVLLISLLIFVAITVKNKSIFSKIIYSCFLIIVLLQSIIHIGNIILYKYWDSIFSIKAYPYFKDIRELFKNVSSINILFFVAYLLFTGLVFHLVFKLLVDSHLQKLHENYKFYWQILLIFILVPISFLALRGGLREIPRNQSDGYFCTNRTYNIATINSTWNFFNVLVENQKFIEKNPYEKLDSTLVQSRIDSLFGKAENGNIQLWNSTIKPPNIVLITMEGVTAEMFQYHNHSVSYMPFLESIMDSSYYFSQAYSVGSRTEQGLAAMLSGCLATPFNSLTDNINTLPKIPSILDNLNDNKYNTTFLFGGNVEFANMRAYLTEIGFDKIIDILDFEPSLRKQSLGVPDEYLFEKLAELFQQTKQPFFIHTLTLSTHEPFDIPKSNPTQSEKKLYINSVKYLDVQLQKFFEQIKHSPKFNNTIFIITSDHSHRLPENWDIAMPERYHIPLIFYSPLLKNEFKGYKDSLYFAQQNLPATLTYLFHWKEKNYLSYSKNHFSNAPKFTFSTFVNGYLYQRDSLRISYDYVWRPYDTTNSVLVNAHSYPQAILQRLTDQIRGIKPIQ